MRDRLARGAVRIAPFIDRHYVWTLVVSVVGYVAIVPWHVGWRWVAVMVWAYFYGRHRQRWDLS